MKIQDHDQESDPEFTTAFDNNDQSAGTLKYRTKIRIKESMPLTSNLHHNLQNKEQIETLVGSRVVKKSFSRSYSKESFISSYSEDNQFLESRSIDQQKMLSSDAAIEQIKNGINMLKPLRDSERRVRERSPQTIETEQR